MSAHTHRLCAVFHAYHSLKLGHFDEIASALEQREIAGIAHILEQELHAGMVLYEHQCSLCASRFSRARRGTAPSVATTNA